MKASDPTTKASAAKSVVRGCSPRISMPKNTPITGTTVIEMEDTAGEGNSTMRYHIHCAKMLEITAP